MKLAVIGSGISGLSAAWLAHRDPSGDFDVRLFEKDSRIGGHAHTVTAEFGTESIAVDSGFIVYNELNYPNLVNMFDVLNVETIASDMSFGVSLRGGELEYEGSLGGLFAQKKNLLNPRFWSMLKGLVKFYRTAVHEQHNGPADETLGAFIDRCNLPAAFVEDHLLPMGAAIWSCPSDTMRNYPVRAFIQFMENHRLLDFTGRPLWRTVKGGSRSYVNILKKALGERISTGVTITGIRREAGGVILSIDGEGDVWFDRVIMAAHADESLALISDAHRDETNILSGFTFQPNHVVLHSDTALMPQAQKAWAAWNYETLSSGESADVCVTYWMNKLQAIDNDYPLFVTLNPVRMPDKALVHQTFSYDHPVFDTVAIAAQQRLPEIQGRDNIYWCGAWTANGFHEDGLKSAVAVMKTLGVTIPWASETDGYPKHGAGAIQQIKAG